MCIFLKKYQRNENKEIKRRRKWGKIGAQAERKIGKEEYNEEFHKHSYAQNNNNKKGELGTTKMLKGRKILTKHRRKKETKTKSG